MEDWPVVAAGFLGSVLAALGTAVGALPILARPHWGSRSQVVLLSGAAGVMLGATVFSLLIPAIEIASEDRDARMAALVAALGLLLGAVAIALLNRVIPHEHVVRGREGMPAHLNRYWLFVLAIALHNFPEGMSVGVAYGAGTARGVAVTVGIGLQNAPEGLAVAAAMVALGKSRATAFGIALLTGGIEPIGGLVGATAVSLATGLLPWALAFAAGAMLFVVSGEIIPETHRPGLEKLATFSLVIGFAVMLILDALIA